MPSDVARTTSFRTSDGLVLIAEAYGEADAPPVLLVHGGGQTRHSWGGTAKRLADLGWQAIVYDQRGHGDSDRSPDGSYKVEFFGRDLRDVAASLQSPPVVVGASLGGLAGLLVAGDLAPGLLRALVLVDVTPRNEREGVDRIISFMLDRVEQGFATLDEAADAVAAYRPHKARPDNHEGLRKNLRLDPDGRWRWHWDVNLFNADRGLAAGGSPGRMEAAALALDLPTLLVRGKLSDLVSEQTAAEFLELAPHAGFVDISGAGHMVAGDRNDRFTDAVADFLRTLLPLP